MATRLPPSGLGSPRADDEFVTALFREHGRSMLAYAIRLTGDRGEAEDAVQETLIRAWRHANNLTEREGSVRGWLLTVLRNILTDRARARSARPTEVAETSGRDPQERDHADGVVDSVVVLDALSTLSPEHREVLERMYIAGRTASETAGELGIPVGTVKSRSFYALRQLREAMPARDGGKAGAA